MGDQIARGVDLEVQAEKKLKGWAIFGSKYEDAAELFEKASNAFKLAKSWDQAGSAYIKLANCHLKLDSQHEAASAYVNASNCFKKTNTKEAIHCLEQAVNLFLDMGRLNMSARYYKEIAELCEADGENLERAMDYYERAADLFQSEEVTTSANQCRQKIAHYAAQLEQHMPTILPGCDHYHALDKKEWFSYQKAVEIYEDIARQSLNNNLLKYGVRGHLLNAGICQLCKGRGETVAINNALEKYQDLDPTFSGTREYKLLADLADAIDQEDILKFTDAVKEFDCMTQLDAWKTTLLLRVKEALKAKELDDDDLT